MLPYTRRSAVDRRDEEILNELLPAFGADFAERASRLEAMLASLVAKRDDALLESAILEAHTLRGGALVLGLLQAPEALAEIERALAHSRSEGTPVERRLPELARQVREELGPIEAAAGRPDAGASAGARTGRRHVLCVDDNAPSATLVERALARRTDIHVSIAHTGAEALELAARDAPDLVLLDLRLPDLPGEELLRRLRELPPLKLVPVVVLSAGADDEQIERLRRAGIADYLTKPLDLGRLLEVVDAALQTSG
jgi:CheY-like chemotaxis protein